METDITELWCVRGWPGCLSLVNARGGRSAAADTLAWWQLHARGEKGHARGIGDAGSVVDLLFTKPGETWEQRAAAVASLVAGSAGSGIMPSPHGPGIGRRAAGCDGSCGITWLAAVFCAIVIRRDRGHLKRADSLWLTMFYRKSRE
jgi:hypothetical protein